MKNEKILRCNNCGREIVVEQGVIREGVFRTEWDWGYFSDKDGERHSFCLCEACYDRITKAFALPVAVEEYL